MLGKNDILVTNHKDKQEQIPKILAVNEEVKRTFSKAMQRRLTNFNNSLSLQLHAEVFK